MSELWAHQEQAVEKARSLDNLALFFDTGTGKTRTMIEILREEYNSYRTIFRTLILAPLSVCAQWKTEFAKFAPKFPQDRIFVLTMHGKKRTEILKTLKAGAIVVTNYDCVTIKAFVEALYEWKPEIMIFDESQRLKDSTTTRSKKLAPLADQARRRFIMTGTPVLNSPLDLFGQMRVLDGGRTWGKNFYIFRRTYAYDKNAGMPSKKHFPKWAMQTGAEQRLAAAIAPYCCQAKKSECLDLPPLVKVEVPVQLGPKQARAYLQMEKEFVAEIQAGEVMVAEFALTKSLRLQQIVAGFGMVPRDEGETEAIPFQDNPRIAALEDTLESIGPAQAIIWSVFRATYPMIGKVCEKLGRSYAFLTGEQTITEKQKAIRDFQEGKIQDLIANPAAGGVGINLAEAPYAVYYTRNYSLEQFLQSEARNYRGGSERHDKVTHFHLMATGTIDEVVLKALMQKKSVGDAILAWAKQRGGVGYGGDLPD